MPDAPGDHLAEPELHEFLDGELTGRRPSEVQRHLAECPECTRRLAHMRELFDLLERLPEEIEASDLAPSVIRSLQRPRRSRWGLGRTAVAQGLGVLLIVLLLGPGVPGWLSGLATFLPDPWTVGLVRQATGEIAALGDEALSVLSAPIVPLREFAAELAAWPLATGAALALVAVGIGAWMAVNTLLLRRARQHFRSDVA